MSMAFSPFLLPNFSPLSTASAKHIDSSSYPSSLPSFSFLQLYKTNSNKTEFPVPKVASIPYQPINVDYLEEEFSGHGVIFKGIGDSCVAKMELENGSKAIMMLPSGLITSYKASMWHGGTVELLQASVSESEEKNEGAAAAAGVAIQGGVSLAFDCVSEDEQVSWSPTNWALHDIRGNPQQEIQVGFYLLSSQPRNLSEQTEFYFIFILHQLQTYLHCR